MCDNHLQGGFLTAPPPISIVLPAVDYQLLVELVLFQEYIETEGLAIILHKVIVKQIFGCLSYFLMTTGAWACPVPLGQCMVGGSQVGHVENTEYAPRRV